MPTTEVHDQSILFGSIPLILISRSLLPDHEALLIGISFLYSGLLISPDLDQAPRSTISRRWGPLRILWTPYGKLLSHRSKLSHSLIGTSLRMLYLFPITLLPLIYFGVDLFPIFFGWAVADLLHYLLDHFFRS